MTATKHEAAAENEEAAAKAHQNEAAQGAAGARGAGCPGAAAAQCLPGWTSVRQPTGRHLEDFKRHAALAAEHRAASQTLRDAEARACRNIPERDIDVSPFYHREDIVSVAPVTERLGRYGRRVIGTSVVFAAVPGLTSEWLQRVVDCHLARNAVLGDEENVMSYCPLAVPRAKAVVHSAGNGFAVEVTSDDARSAKEIASRAAALAGRPAPN